MRYSRIIALLCLIIHNSQQKVLPVSEENIQTLQDLADPGYESIDGLKEKRCNDASPFNLVGSIQRPRLSLPLVLKRRDLALKKSACEMCRATFCTQQQPPNCDHCTTICKTSELEPENPPILESRSNIEQGGLSENQDRYYSVGAVGPGPRQDVIARLLNIPKHAKLDRLIILAKNRSNNKLEAIPHPVIIDTAHVFTPNDGKAPQLDPELHNVDKNGDDFDTLTKELNKELDVAIETKKKLRGDSHLTADEIDKIINHATQQISHQTKNLPQEETNRDNIVGSKQQITEKDDEDKVGCSKETEESDEYYREAETKTDMTPIIQSPDHTKEEQVGRAKSAESEELMYLPPNIYRNPDETEDKLLGAPQQESIDNDILESKSKPKHNNKGKGYNRENDEDVNLEARNQKSSEEKKESDNQEVESQETKEDQNQKTEDKTIQTNNEELKIENNEENNLLGEKFKHNKKGKGGHYRENTGDEEEETTTVPKSKESITDGDGSIKQDGILQHKFKLKKKNKKGKGYSGYGGYYRENEDDETQRSAAPAYQEPPQYYQDNHGAQYEDQQYHPMGGNQYQPSRNQYQPMNNQYQPMKTQYQGMPNRYQPIKNGYQTPPNAYQTPNNKYQPMNPSYQPGYQPKNQYQPMNNDYRPTNYQPSNQYYKTQQKEYQPSKTQYQSPSYQVDQPKNIQMANQDPYHPDIIHMPAKEVPVPGSENQYAQNYDTPSAVNNYYDQANEMEPVEMEKDLPVYAKVEPSEEEEGGDYNDYVLGSAQNSTKHEQTADSTEKQQNDEPLPKDWSKQYDTLKQWLQENSQNHEKLRAELPQFLQILEENALKNKANIEKLSKEVSDLSKEKLGAVQEDLSDNNETVGCSKESSEEELMYLKPLYGNDYRNSKGGKNPLLEGFDKILHPGKIDGGKKAEDSLDHILHTNRDSLSEPVKEVEESIKKLLHPKSRKDDSGDNKKAPLSPALSSLIKDLEKMRESLPTLPPMHHKHHHRHPSALPTEHEIEDQDNHMNANPAESNFGGTFEDDHRDFMENNGRNRNFNDFDGARNFDDARFGEMPPNNPQFVPNFGNIRNFQPELKSRNSNFHNFRDINPSFLERPDMMVGAPYYQHDLSHFGKMVPQNLPLNIHNRDVSEQVAEKKGKKMFFVGDGIKLPLHMKEHDDGSLHLSVDVHKLCKCNSTGCEHNHGDFLDVKKIEDKKSVVKRSPKFDIFKNLNIKEDEMDETTEIGESYERKEGVFENVLSWLQKLGQDLKEA